MKKTGFAIGISAALFLPGCGSETAPTTPESQPNTAASSTTAASCGRLAIPEFSFGKPDGIIAKNTGECANVRDEDTYKDIGNIAAGADFNPICLTGPKPAGIRIEFPAQDNPARHGEVLLDDAVIAGLGSGAFPPGLKEC